MARKPPNFQWLGFTDDQLDQLDFFDFIGNNAWAPTGQTEEAMPAMLKEWADSGRTLADLLEAMAAIGYGRHALHQLERWESKRLTGKFGR